MTRGGQNQRAYSGLTGAKRLRDWTRHEVAELDLLRAFVQLKSGDEAGSGSGRRRYPHDFANPHFFVRLQGFSFTGCATKVVENLHANSFHRAFTRM
ncbi:MAG: hypothetical protein KGJ32_09955 [Xanthomonadaceae bacterium]|nr:hypothetical protein [Xanthomonadaceae bacterium]